MKKICAALSVIIFSSVLMLAQQQTKDRKSESGNNAFAPPSEEFSIVSSPVTLVARSLSSDNASRRYRGTADQTYFYIFSDSLKAPAQYTVVSDFLKNFQTSATDVFINNTAGEKFAFADADGFVHKILIVKTKKRIYVFQTVSLTENDADAERFFAGIQFDRETQAGQPNAAEEKNGGGTAADVKNSQTDNNGIGHGTGRSSGNGFGSGSGNGGNNNGGGGQGTGGDLTNTGQTTPLSLSAKPRANYTDFARFYEISGLVRVRVTFSATGEIGAVTPLTKLPFGLTSQALEAARGIRFAPAMKNGQPYSVVKMVEYHFTIY